ncbi:MAG: YebC/PmpR family DNA-binding transcriptional regulator [Gammaproteobacteria bacterium]|nr:YebC/PmpR family DNA-binding transcriptional regulator [Gammaproteobacteria bacterium]
MGRAYQNRKASMAKTSDANAKVYSKYGREIYVVAKSGGGDPNGNLALRAIISRAKKDQVPSHVIDKAIKKAEGGGGEDFAVARYEGFGPGGCKVIVECLTDNPNRTFGDVRQCFTKTKSKIGTPGTVAHMFDHASVFVFNSEDEEGILDVLLEADIDVTDIEMEDGKMTVLTPDSEYAKTRHALTDAVEGVDFDVEEIQFLPMATMTLADDDVEMFDKFEDMLTDLDDVQKVYHDIAF